MKAVFTVFQHMGHYNYKTYEKEMRMVLPVGMDIRDSDGYSSKITDVTYDIDDETIEYSCIRN